MAEWLELLTTSKKHQRIIMKTNETNRKLLLNGLLITVAVAAIFVGAVSAWREGANFDSRTTMLFNEQNLQQLGYPNNFQSSQTFPKEVVASYGYSVQIINHVLGKFVTNLLGQEFSLNNSNVYSARNLVTFLVSLFAFWGVFQIVRNLTNKNSIGWLGVTCLLAIGSFTGNSLNNDKDVPLASGLVLLLAVLINGYLYRCDLVKSSRFYIQNLIFLFFGTIFTIGSRPGFWPIVFVLLSAILIIYHGYRRMLLSLIGSLLGAMTYVMLTNGYFLHSPLWWFQNAIAMSDKFPWTGQVMIRSQNYPAGYRWYLPFMVLIQTPLLMILLSSFAVGLVVFMLLNKRCRATQTDRKLIVSVLLLSSFSLGLVFIAVVQSAVTYDGARQFLFVYPLIAAISAISSWWVFNNARRKSVRLLTVSALTVGLAVPLLATIQLFPYQHIYTSEWSLWDSTISDNAFDNQAVSSRETQSWINRNYRGKNIAYLPEQTYAPFIKGNKLVSTQDSEMQLYAQLWRPAFLPNNFTQCKQVFALTRSQFWIERVLNLVRDCSQGLTK